MGVTVAGGAPLSARQVPKVGAAAVTALSFDIRQTLTLAAAFAAQTLVSGGALTAIGSQEVTDALPAVAS